MVLNVLNSLENDAIADFVNNGNLMGALGKSALYDILRQYGMQNLAEINQWYNGGDEDYVMLHYFLLGHDYQPYVDLLNEKISKKFPKPFVTFDVIMFNTFHTESNLAQLYGSASNGEYDWQIERYAMACRSIIGTDYLQPIVLMLSNKKYAHTVLCYSRVYVKFCKQYVLERKAEIANLHDWCGKRYASKLVEFVFADEWIVSTIVMFL